MATDDSQSFPDWIEDAYEILRREFADQQGGVTRDRAIECLVNQESFPTDAADAAYAIRRLLNTGWLYEVNGEVRITDPEE